MAEEAQLPPQIQEELLRLQQLQQQLQSVVAQRQQLEIELGETDKALAELEKLADDKPVFKSIGSILVRADRQNLLSELKDKKELLNTRVTVLSRQEERTKERVKEVQQRLQERLQGTKAG